jgi:hypothetical protein
MSVCAVEDIGGGRVRWARVSGIKLASAPRGQWTLTVMSASGRAQKRAQTKWHEASLGGSLWHERADQSVYQLPDQPSCPALIMLRPMVRFRLAPQKSR